MKTCRRKNCEQVNPQPLTQFYPHKAKLDGLDTWCKACKKKYDKDQYRKHKYYRQTITRKNAYGITQEQFEGMLTNQGNCCAICNVHSSQLQRPLNVDHDHQTNIIRLLLCNSCNNGLGCFRDNVDLLEIAIIYLKGF